MALTTSQMSFAGGELSPLFVHRFGEEFYALGARTLENFIVTETGSLTRRPGTYHADNGSTKGNTVAYLAPWVYHDEDAYVLEFTPLAIRVYRNHGLVESSPGVPLVIATPFTAAELPYLQIWQSGDVLWLRSEDRWNYKLTRTSHTVWTLTAVYPQDGPWRTTNATDTTLRALGTGKPGTPVVIQASAAVFQSEHVNSAWRIDHILPERSQEKTFSSEENDTATLLVAKGGEWEFTVQVAGGAAADATVKLQASYDAVTWWDYRIVPVLRATSDQSWLEKLFDKFRGRNEAVDDAALPIHSNTNEEDRAIYLRAACTTWVSGSIKTTITVKPYLHSGVIWLTFYTSPTQMSGFIRVSPANTDATTGWAEGAVNGVRGYWRALGFQGERLLLAGTEDEPLRIDAGQAGDYDNFDPGFAEDSDAFNITLSQSRQNRIHWINGEWNDTLLVGTEGGIVQLRPLGGSGGFTPTNWPSIYRTLRRRTRRIVPLMVDDVLIVPGGVGGRRLYQLFHSNERGGLVAEDLTRYANHIGASGFVGVTVQQDPDQILWLPRADGVLAGCTFAYGATAWHRHTIGDAVVSACTVPTSDGDELWLCVRRTVGSLTRYFVEYARPIDLEADIEDGHYLDCGEAWDGGEPVSVAAIISTDPTVIVLTDWPIDSDGHALANGDTVRFIGNADLDQQIFQVAASNATQRTLQLLDVTGTVAINGAEFTADADDTTLEWVRCAFTGTMDHLPNQILSALVDGKAVSVSVDSSGSISLGDSSLYESYARVVHVGISYASVFVSLPLEFYLSSGLTIGAHKQIGRLTVSLYRSYGGEYGVSQRRYESISYLRDGDQVATGPFLFTGQKDLAILGGTSSDELNVHVRCIGPYPFTVRGLASKIEVHG